MSHHREEDNTEKDRKEQEGRGHNEEKRVKKAFKISKQIKRMGNLKNTE